MYKQIVGGVIGVVVLGILWSSWVIVESGHVGVVRFLGAVEPVALEEAST